VVTYGKYTLTSEKLNTLGNRSATNVLSLGRDRSLESQLDGDYLLFAVGGVFTPDGYGEVHRQAEGVSQALAPWESGTRYLNFEEGEVDAQVFFDADTWRLLRALRSERDPNSLFLANHEIKES
jgi:hypothetical protein